MTTALCIWVNRPVGLMRAAMRGSIHNALDGESVCSGRGAWATNWRAQRQSLGRIASDHNTRCGAW